MSIGPPGDDTWIADERRHERQMAEISHKENERKRAYRQERVGWIVIGVTSVAIAAVLTFGAWKIVDTTNKNNTLRDVSCHESGGTRVSIQNGPVMCLHLGEEVPG